MSETEAMHNHLGSTLERAARVVHDRIEPAIHRPVAQVALESWLVTDAAAFGGKPVTPGHALGRAVDPGREVPSFRPFQLGEPWGRPWSTRWFRITGRVDDVTSPVELLLDLGWFDHSVGGHCEGLVFRPDGTPVKGLHPRQQWVRISGQGSSPGLVDADGVVEVFVEAAANPLLLGLPPFVTTGHGEAGSDEPFEQFRVRRAELAEFRPEVFEFARDLEVATQLVEQVSVDEPRHWQLLRAVEEALDQFDETDPVASAHRARDRLAGPLSLPAIASAHHVTAVAHAHMDSAWLWPLRETRRKLARTVCNALAVLDGDADVVYTMTSAQHFAWLESDHPSLFARVAEQVADGRIRPVGGMWVETDGVLPTGESLVRQILLGRNYFRERFGIESTELWLPDSFGYSAALPQLAARSGVTSMLTQKISWNDTTVFPHHSFWWEGLDGSQVFTHFPPSDTYAASVTAAELVGSVRNFKDKAIATHSLLAYGYGDGGGGPTREMVARLSRFADVEGAPRVTSRPPSEFFADAAAELSALPSTAAAQPRWSGELYLELHRGTSTSQQAMKQGNRRCEGLLRVAERVAATASVLTGAQYPATRLTEIWRRVLLHQFHDILPGTSISWVHREARAAYVEIETELLAVIDAGRASLAASLTPYDARPDAPVPTGERVADDGIVLDNGVLRARFDPDGAVASLTDLSTGDELVLAGQSLGSFVVFRDEPVRWDAWDVDRHTLRHPEPFGSVTDVSIVHDENDAGVRVVRTYGDSSLTSTTWLRAGDALLTTECTVDWHHHERLLKVALPLAVRSPHASYECQYGYVQRPLHTNTAGDEAQFESAVHGYIHVSDGEVDVAVLTPTTSGADARTDRTGRGTLLRLSLLRGARFPDPEADQGRHSFRWAVGPAIGPAAAQRLSVEVARPVEDRSDIPRLLGVESDRGHVHLDWLKLAEDGSGDVVVRLYETAGARATAHLVTHPALAAHVVSEVDLLEGATTDVGPSRALPADGVRAEDVRLTLGPFQICTLRLRAD